MATTDLGSMVVSFTANMDGLTTGQQKFSSFLTSIENSASSMSSSLSSIKPLDASNLIADTSGAQQKLLSVASAGADLSTDLSNIRPFDAGGTVSDVDVAQAKLNLIEQKVTEARATLQKLQGAADAGEAVTGIEEAQANLTILQGKAQDAESSLKQLQSAADDAGEGTSSGFGGKVMGTVGQIVEFGDHLTGAINGIKEFGQGAVEAGQQLLEPAAENERLQESFTTLMHSSSGAKQEIQDLSQYASGTPMETGWVDNAAEKFLAFGFNVKDVQPNITAIGDSLSGLGKLTDDNLSSMVSVFGKIQAQGKITGDDMMQFTDMGIPAWQMLSKQMGIPVSQLQTMVSNGAIPAKTAIDNLTKGMEKTFGGDMQKQANTFNGLTSTMSSNWQQVLAKVGAPALKELEPLMSKLATALGSKQFTQFATILGTDIGNGIKNFVTGIQNVAKFGQGLTDFFSKNQPAMVAMKIAVIALAGVFGGIMAASLTSMAVAAWAALVPMLPWIAIGAGIALAIAGIVLAVQHWGEIAHWLQGIWGGIAGFFAGIWAAITSGISSAWGAIVAFFAGTWATISGGVSSAWNGIISWLAGVWGGIAGLAQGAWNGVVNVFSGVWGSISGALGGLWSNISGWFGNLASSAVQWGSNIIQGFIDGINNMINAAGQAASNVVNAVKNFLGFSSPAKMGPGRELNVWGPNMVKGFSQGILNSIPTLQAAMSALSLQLTPVVAGQSLTGSTAALPAPSLISPLAVAQAASVVNNNTQQGNGDIHIYMDGKEITNQVMTRATRTMRQQGGKMRTI